jgi:hypothetical protein
MEDGRRCLSVAKGRHRYVFWFSEGQEAALLGSLVELCERSDTNLDPLDAALLSYQMGERIGNTADRQAVVFPR